MHVHLPKPLHGWREFVGEVGIIVIGVLIALSAEQLVEEWHWRSKIDAADAAMRTELFVDDGPEIYQRAAMHPCVQAQLDRIRVGIERGESRQQVTDLIAGFWLEFVTFDSLAHDAANASDVATHMAPEHVHRLINAYGLIPLMESTSEQESVDLGRLHALLRTGGSISVAEATGAVAAVEALRSDDQRMWHAAKWSLPALRALGGDLDRTRTQLLMQDARVHYGACVKDLPSNFPAAVPNATGGTNPVDHL